jgi:hypothetical protein
MPDLIEDWRTAARPLLVVDEIRPDGTTPGEQFVATVFVETDTRTAVKWAETALAVRDELAQARDKCFKGSSLYGSRRKSSHGPMREHVRAVLNEARGAFRVTTTNRVLENHPSGRGGIHAVPATPKDQLRVEAVRGAELVPLMNSIKVIAAARNLGDVQVDVLVDRSRQLGLDPKVLGVSPDTIQMFGPDTLNHLSDGSPASLISPTRFRIISAPEEGRLRDLLMIPDVVAYLLDLQKEHAEARKALDAGEEFWIEVVNLKSLIDRTTSAPRRSKRGAAVVPRKSRSR